MYASRIKMQTGCEHSVNVEEIASIYIEGCDNPGFFPKEVLHNFLKENPKTIKVKISPYPYVVPATSAKGEKYVRSSPNNLERDNLMNLPRD